MDKERAPGRSLLGRHELPKTPTNYQADHELPEALYLIYGHHLTVLITHAAVMVLHRCHPTASAVCMPRRLGSRPWPNKNCTTAAIVVQAPSVLLGGTGGIFKGEGVLELHF